MVIRVKGVKRVVAKGRVYYYHRKSMTRLPGVPGTTAFMDALASAEQAKAAPEPAPLPGSLGGLITVYRMAPEFTGLAERTRTDYQKVFNYLRPLDALPLLDIDRGFLYEVRDKAFAKKKRRFANYVLQVLSRLFNWGKSRDLIDDNPAGDVDSIRRPRDARLVNRAWKDEEIATVLAAAPAELRLAIAIGAYLGLRVGDALKATWACYDGRAFEIRQHKTGETLWVPVHRDLRQILDAAALTKRSPVIIVGVKGKPYTVTGFQTRFFGLLKRLRDGGKITAGLSFHGLRHTVGKKLAEAGCDARTIASILGQKTTAMAEHYSRQADRHELARAAITKLETKGRPTSATSSK